MSNWCRKLVLLLALTLLPLQGMAATLSALFCHDDQQTHEMHPHEGHDQGALSQQDDGGSSGHAIEHLCCHQAASGVLVMTLPRALVPDGAVLISVPQPLQDLFVPDRPQRPPLA